MKFRPALWIAMVLATALPGSAATVTLIDDHFDPSGIVQDPLDEYSTIRAGWGAWMPTVACGAGGALSCIEQGGLSYMNLLHDGVTGADDAIYELSVTYAGSTAPWLALISLGNGDGYFSFIGKLLSPEESYLPKLETPFTFTTQFTSASVGSNNLFLYLYGEADHEGDNTGPWGSLYLDRVVLTMTTPDVPAPVPLPASAPLLAAGLGALGLLRRRRRR